jgi:hypothetical protein
VSEVRSNNKASHLAERARERPERWSSSSQLPAREARIHSSTYHSLNIIKHPFARTTNISTHTASPTLPNPFQNQ